MGQDVAGFDALGRGVAAFGDGGDIQAARQAVMFGVRRVDGADGDADAGPDIAAGGDELVADRFGRDAGDRKADALHGHLGVGVDHLHVRDADDLAVHIEQRTAGVALIDGGVGLDQRHGVAVGADAAVDGGDDTVGHGAAQGVHQRVADGDDAVAHAQLAAVAEFGGVQPLGLDLQHGKVHLRILADELCRGLRAVGQDDRRLIGAGDKVLVGEDEAVLTHDDAGAPVIADLALLRGLDADDGLHAAGVKLLQRQLIAASGALQREAEIGAGAAALDVAALGRVGLLLGIIPGEEVLVVLVIVLRHRRAAVVLRGVAVAGAGDLKGEAVAAVRLPLPEGPAAVEGVGEGVNARHDEQQHAQRDGGDLHAGVLFLLRLRPVLLLRPGLRLGLRRAAWGVPVAAGIIVLIHRESLISASASGRRQTR